MAEFRVDGMRELSRKLKELGAAAGGAVLRSAAREAMRPVEDAARASAPVGEREHKTHKGRVVLPGFAKRSIRRATQMSRAAPNKVRAMVGVRAEAFYALAFVERGTSKMPAQPWLVPAFEATQGQALDRFRDTLKRKIERAAR